MEDSEVVQLFYFQPTRLTLQHWNERLGAKTQIQGNYSQWLLLKKEDTVLMQNLKWQHYEISENLHWDIQLSIYYQLTYICISEWNIYTYKHGITLAS